MLRGSQEDTTTLETLKLEIFHANNNYTMISDSMNSRYRVDISKLVSFYYGNWSAYANCMIENGCNEAHVSSNVRTALKDFHSRCNGDKWRIRWDLNDGDPCVNKWFGVHCNTKG